MCFYLRYTDSRGRSRRVGRKVAYEDIVCYKVLIRRKGYGKEVSYYSPYQDFEYKFGETYRTRIRIKGKGVEAEIGPGLHSYTERDKAIAEAAYQGRHLGIAVPCVIPKGAVYYYNPSDMEYVSSRLRMPETYTVLREEDDYD